MSDFGEAFRNPIKNDDKTSDQKFLLPGTSSYIPFLVADETKKPLQRTSVPESEKRAEDKREEYVSRYIVTPDTPPPQYNPGEILPRAPEPYVPLTLTQMNQAYMWVSMAGTLPPPVVIPVSPVVRPDVPVAENPVETTKSKRNQKRNTKRRRENRKRPSNLVATVDIPPDDPYWLPALDKVVVAVSAHYVDRSAKMEDGADIRVRSFADGTVVAIRDDVQVVLVQPSDD